MRFEEVTYECDLCGAEADGLFVPQGDHGESHTIPDGWLRVTVKTGAGAAAPFKRHVEVCGLECLSKITTRWRREAQGELSA